MDYTTLGRTELRVSTLCLGSMTWGSQNTEAEGHAQIDRALDAGINFIDTAEMYPANPGPSDYPGKTEDYIGTWIEKSGRRGDVVLATKITGEGSSRARGGAPITPQAIREALDASLKRLRTDYVDLYQLHWPNRGSYHFRKYWDYDPTGIDAASVRQDTADILGELQRQIEAGKVRHIGLSNETAWGTRMFLELSEREGLPRVATIQNEYSLMCRIFDLDLGELACTEDVDLLAYSPLACGILSGKYAGDTTPAGSRRSLNATINGRLVPTIWPAHDAYLDAAEKHGLDPAQMALAFCLTRPFMGSVIFGATSIPQLETAIGAADLTLSDEVMDDIKAAYRQHPMPF
ncbi:aldo/keto reductase [Rhodobium gokarnense]|uniref:Aryl-alcohol dehydrogenase-like predicted oxidoreductase n=1 Tax=Rhodobium gokarnense TaxID=364296 RepID=A0ABT3H7J1_9HYPH|nr:aldo/keto reductase [Rhodobium gokarnense]MCW2306354.1 aryl-alcohol dehydrogenase-like predicted oxidoreductase [Rhodobium gokarnense]